MQLCYKLLLINQWKLNIIFLVQVFKEEYLYFVCILEKVICFENVHYVWFSYVSMFSWNDLK